MLYLYYKTTIFAKEFNRESSQTNRLQTNRLIEKVHKLKHAYLISVYAEI